MLHGGAIKAEGGKITWFSFGAPGSAQDRQKKPFKALTRRHNERANVDNRQRNCSMDKEEREIRLNKKLQSEEGLSREMLTYSVLL